MYLSFPEVRLLMQTAPGKGCGTWDSKDGAKTLRPCSFRLLFLTDRTCKARRLRHKHWSVAVLFWMLNWLCLHSHYTACASACVSLHFTSDFAVRILNVPLRAGNSRSVPASIAEINHLLVLTFPSKDRKHKPQKEQTRQSLYSVLEAAQKALCRRCFHRRS